MTMPPGPGAPAALQTLQFVTQPLALLDRCHARYGDVFRLRLLGSGDWVLVSHPDHVKALFAGDPETVRGGLANASVFAPLTGTTSSLVTDARPHAVRRRLLMPPFAGERMRGYADPMAEIALQEVRSWPAGAAFALGPRMRHVALQIILRTIFGLQRGAQAGAGDLAELLVAFGEAGVASPLLFFPALQVDLGRYSPWGRILDLRRRTDAALFAEIERRRAAPEDAGGDVLSVLLATRTEDGRLLSDQELRDELVTMLFAGHETTALALTWAFERILAYPEVEAGLRAELDAVLGDRPVRAEDLPQLEYMDAVLKEVLRTRPIGPIAGNRRLTAPFDLGGYQLPAGTIVANCCYLAHKRPDVYPDPERFDPERFLGRKPDANRWTPFGGGARRCPGSTFALFEMKIVIATVLRGARLTAVHPSRKVERHGFFIGPEAGLPVRIGAVAREAA